METDFPKKRKSPTDKEVSAFSAGLRYPKLAAFVVNKLMAKFGFKREQAEAAWKARA
jgi:hypothetical protein